MRLNKIQDEYGDKVDIGYRSFLLRPEPDPDCVFNDYRRAHWINANDQPESGDFRMWESDEKFPVCSIVSAEAGLAARDQGKAFWDRFHLNLLTAFFTENRNISDAAVLMGVAEESGLDVDSFRDDLESGVNRRRVVEEYVEAVNRYGISGIPSVVVNEEAVMVGAVPSEHYRHVIDNILETGVLPKKFSGDLPTV